RTAVAGCRRRPPAPALRARPSYSYQPESYRPGYRFSPTLERRAKLPRRPSASPFGGHARSGGSHRETAGNDDGAIVSSRAGEPPKPSQSVRPRGKRQCRAAVRVECGDDADRDGGRPRPVADLPGAAEIVPGSDAG